MNKKVTIRDVAEEAGVSISSVHLALNGKVGVSESTRDRIRQIADEMGYQPNAIASSLKRKTQRIAVLLPGEEGNNRYFYPPVWRGVRDCLASMADMNLECTELSYSAENEAEVFGRVRQLIRERRIDGLLTVGHVDTFLPEDWKELEDNEIEVVFMGAGNEDCRSLCCIQPDYDVIGRTMAEMITSHIPPCGSIFLCAGNPEWSAHSQIVQGFEAYLTENNAPNMVYKDRSWNMDERNYIHILRQIARPDVAACCSVLSQSSVLMGQALEESGKADMLFAVGSDLSEENIDRLKRRVFDTIIQKNPYAQGYVSTRTLVEYLVRGKVPERSSIYVGSEVVFRSNLVMYEHGRYRQLLL